nr:MAG TPA: hypothetical protein [Caudoviricetes sp.]
MPDSSIDITGLRRRLVIFCFSTLLYIQVP